MYLRGGEPLIAYIYALGPVVAQEVPANGSRGTLAIYVPPKPGGLVVVITQEVAALEQIG